MVTFITSTRPFPTRNGESSRPPNSSQITPEARTLCTKLAPLRQVEENLILILSGRAAPPRRRTTSQTQDRDDPEDECPSNASRLPPEIVFPSKSRWKGGFGLTRLFLDSQQPGSVSSVNQSLYGQSRRILATLGDEIVKFWNDPTVQSLLKLAEIRLDEQPGLYVCSSSLMIDLSFNYNFSFLDHIPRITREDYVPRPGMFLMWLFPFPTTSYY